MSAVPFAVRIPAVAVLSLALCTAAFGADRDMFTFGPKDVNPNFEEPGAWQEQAGLHLPPWPQDANLVEFQTSGPATPFRHFIDTKSLSVDAQKIVRYTVVVESGSGSRNIAYEGIRCTPNGEYRLYAYGVAGNFKVVPESGWGPVNAAGVPDYAKDLQRFFLCVPLKFEPRPLKEMPRILGGRGKPRDHSGFLTD